MEARTALTAQGPPGMPCRLRKITRQHGAPDIFPCPLVSSPFRFPVVPHTLSPPALPADDFPQAEKKPPSRTGWGLPFQTGRGRTSTATSCRRNGSFH